MTASSWYVFVEEDTDELVWVDNKNFFVHRWHLVESRHVDGGRQEAEAAAQELADSYVPHITYGRGASGSRPGRSIFRMHDGAWLVTVKYGAAKAHYRVSIGELIRVEEEIEGEQPSKPKGGLKRMFGS